MRLQQWQQKLHAALEQRIVAERRVLSFSKLRQRNRALTEAFQRQEIDAAALRGALSDRARDGRIHVVEKFVDGVIALTQQLEHTDPRSLTSLGQPSP